MKNHGVLVLFFAVLALASFFVGAAIGFGTRGAFSAFAPKMPSVARSSIPEPARPPSPLPTFAAPASLDDPECARICRCAQFAEMWYAHPTVRDCDGDVSVDDDGNRLEHRAGHWVRVPEPRDLP